MRFEARRGERFHRYFYWVQTDLDLWWSHRLRKWVTHEEAVAAGGGYSNSASCRTLRAFKRMLRKNPQIIGSSVLVSKYEGFNIYA